MATQPWSPRARGSAVGARFGDRNVQEAVIVSASDSHTFDSFQKSSALARCSAAHVCGESVSAEVRIVPSTSKARSRAGSGAAS